MVDIDLESIDKIQKSVELAAKMEAKRAKKEMRKDRMLTDQQEMFCQLFVKYGGDYKKAWTEAGYSTEGKYWYTEASKMRSKPHIWRRIEELRQSLVGESGINQDWILAKAKQIADKAYLTGQLKDGIASLELIAKIIGAIKGDKQAAQAGIMQMNLAFFGAGTKADMSRLAQAAGMRLVEDQTEIVDVTPASPN